MQGCVVASTSRTFWGQYKKTGMTNLLLVIPSIKQCYVPLVERIGRNKAVGIAQLLLVGLKVGHGDIAHDVVVLLG